MIFITINCLLDGICAVSPSVGTRRLADSSATELDIILVMRSGHPWLSEIGVLVDKLDVTLTGIL